MVVALLNALVLWNNDIEQGLVSVYEDRAPIIL